MRLKSESSLENEFINIFPAVDIGVGTVSSTDGLNKRTIVGDGYQFEGIGLVTNHSKNYQSYCW